MNNPLHGRQRAYILAGPVLILLLPILFLCFCGQEGLWEEGNDTVIELDE